LVFVIAFEIGDDKDALKKKDLGEIDESIEVALFPCSCGTGRLGALGMM
jgi:hypothetical protein